MRSLAAKYAAGHLVQARKVEPYHMRYNCGPVTKKFHEDMYSRVKLLMGPFGTGKTSAGIFDQVMMQTIRVVKSKGMYKAKFAVVRNTYKQLRDTTMRTVFNWFPPENFGRFYKQDNIFKINLEDREIEIFFRALDLEKDVRNLLSLEITGAWIDEAREISSNIFKHILGRIGRFPTQEMTGVRDPFLTPPQVILTSNYPSREHWLYRDFVEKPIEGYAIYEADQNENKHNLRPGYYEDLEKDYADRPDLLRTLVRGEWGVTVRGKQVYPEFDRNTHVSQKPLLPLVRAGIAGGRTQVIVGWDDTGLSPAAVLTYVNGLGQWLVFKEFCGEDIGLIDFGEMVWLWCMDKLPGSTTYRHIGDPGARSRDTAKISPAEYLQQALGIHIESGVVTFQPRREAVAGRLTRSFRGEPAILIDPSCVRLIDGFEGGYAYPEIRMTGIFRPDPEKNEYCVPLSVEALTPNGWKTYRELSKGDSIYTKSGIGQIREINFFQNAEIYRIGGKTENAFYATKEHRHIIETRNGCEKIVKTKDLKQGHSLFSLDGRQTLEVQEIKRISSEDAWCPTTTDGTWICRMPNGRIFLTGNSHIHEALQYPASRLFVPKSGPDPPEEELVPEYMGDF